MSRFFAGAATLAFTAAFSFPSHANDSQAETALGGLTLKHSDSIRMDSEDLYVSRDRVRVTYRFTNTSDRPIETLVAFPLPDIPPDYLDNKVFWSSLDDLKFKTTVDGKPLVHEIVQQAFFNGKDVTARLSALKIPLNYRDQSFAEALKKTPKPERDKLIAEGLLRDDSTQDAQFYTALWSLRTSVTRMQTFPANASVVVEHEYVPLLGGSVGGGLSASARKNDYFKNEQRKYCIDKEWLASFDKRMQKTGNRDIYGEIWLGYVLTTGANWKGPIGDFRLVIDKGKPDTLVSFCAEGVKKISPTQFEVRHKDFTPKKDLDILIVQWPQ
ncbi:DUF4424 family protein [Methylocystis iwaonis]|uniref:DUF4424 domain-containing protein n=1 Tax=Methylocystis iwaonis TaxID=2885079 RepID=A0ABN6VFW7_9HYPH|nr:DUF4424 family protein [Methylocystis iwaonis]BDV34590.1 hypothetical protein SS37A_21190 [Methylocystis iwaonis]